MKMIKYLLSASIIVAIISCQSNSLKIEIDLNNFIPEDGEGMATVNVRDSSEWIVADSIMLKGGKGKLSFSPEGPTSFYLSIEGLPEAIAGFGHHGKLTLSGDASIFPFQGRLEGTKSQDDLNSFMKKQSDFREFTNSLNETYSIASSVGDTSTIDSLTFIMNKKYSILQKETKEFALSHDVLGAYITNRYLSMEEIGFIDSVLANVKDYNSQDIYLLKNRSEALHRVDIGQQFTDILQQDTSGNPISISSVDSDFILVDFWASWCGPCRAQNPDLVKLHNKWSNRLEIIGVAFDQDRSLWIQAIEDDGLNWPQMSDLKGWGNSAADIYSIRAIPQNILIGPEGEIVARNIKPEELDYYIAVQE
jgi:thiol-disulfide isomerase/thioredoxin